MKKVITLVAILFCLKTTSAQQTIQQSIFLRSNLVNSTEILFFKEDNTSYYDLASNHGGFQIYNSTTAASPFFIKSNDNVGIGTMNPTEKLSVKGKIRAQEIKVEMSNWADFVFAKDYVLPTLQETERHIQEKGHLPGIPSAMEVEKNGIELGDMNKKLLQKIEELTLYLIEQNKCISRLEVQNKNLVSEIEKIKLKP